MMKCVPITDVYAREILDSRGNPTVEVEVLAGDQFIGRAMVPSGASTGQFEAVELRDKDQRYGGKGVRRAVEHVNTILAQEIIGMNVFHQREIDNILQKKDGTPNKSQMGANAILGISMAVARAAAKAMGVPLYRYLGGAMSHRLPMPMMNILNGGKHADNSVDIQEMMIVPIGATNVKEALQMCAEVYHCLKKLLAERKMQTAVGDEGGFAPDFENAKDALRLILASIERAGYEASKDIALALDVAASELYNREFRKYVFEGETRSSEEMIDYFSSLVEEFPIISIEDPLDEEDWDGWELLTTRIGQEVSLVGDDLFVTNTARLTKGIEGNVANAILIKPNQIGTVTETVDAIRMAKKAGYRSIVSHRSGDTEDPFIADLAVALDTGWIKTGAPCRGERTAKYNRLIRIEEMEKMNTFGEK